MSRNASRRSAARNGVRREAATPSEPLPSQALASLWQHGGDVQKQLQRFLAATLDQQKLRLRRAVVLLVAGLTALVVVVAVLCLGVWHLVRGLAGAVATLAPEHPWVGDAGAGLLVLLGIGGGAAALWWSWSRASLRRAWAKYGRGPSAAESATDSSLDDAALNSRLDLDEVKKRS